MLQKECGVVDVDDRKLEVLTDDVGVAVQPEVGKLDPAMAWRNLFPPLTILQLRHPEPTAPKDCQYAVQRKPQRPEQGEESFISEKVAEEECHQQSDQEPSRNGEKLSSTSYGWASGTAFEEEGKKAGEGAESCKGSGN